MYADYASYSKPIIFDYRSTAWTENTIVTFLSKDILQFHFINFACGNGEIFISRCISIISVATLSRTLFCQFRGQCIVPKVIEQSGLENLGSHVENLPQYLYFPVNFLGFLLENLSFRLSMA